MLSFSDSKTINVLNNISQERDLLQPKYRDEREERERPMVVKICQKIEKMIISLEYWFLCLLFLKESEISCTLKILHKSKVNVLSITLSGYVQYHSLFIIA